MYVTRFQKERWTEKERPYPKIDAKFLGEAKYSDASVMHPLPRVNELDASFDTDRRAIYFQQAAYGVPIRMALISLLLHLHKNKSLRQFDGGFAKSEHPVYAQPIGDGLQCDNANCIAGDPAERQYAANKFYVVAEDHPQRCRLRCVYCETDVDEDGRAFCRRRHDANKPLVPGSAALFARPTKAPASRHSSQCGRRDTPPDLRRAKSRRSSSRSAAPPPSIAGLMLNRDRLLASLEYAAASSSAICAARFRSASC